MRTRPSAVVVIGGLIATVALLTGFQVNADETRTAGNGDEMVDAAKDALVFTTAANEAGRATIEDVYQWSLRLMNAEKSAGMAGAAANQLKRMDNLHQRADLLYQAKAKGSSVFKVSASKFYLLEAQAMAREK
jgi:hypothetical protein